MIDLHTHSTASDGTVRPQALVEEAVKAGLSTIALTDHDTVDGVAEFRSAAEQTDIDAVPGVEVAARWYETSLHIVGLYISPSDPDLLELLARIRKNRQERNARILERLDNLGRPVSEATVTRAAGGTVIGRPHIARALVEHGHCRNSREAFEHYLGRRAPAYIRRELPLPHEAISRIHEANGVAIWAHPVGIREQPYSKLRRVLEKLVDVGLDGIEAYYSEYTREQEKLMQDLAEKYALVTSGGSDFHGENFPDIALGRGRGNLEVPDSIVRPLQQRAGMYATACS